jgi:hypothetical protein
MKRRRSVIVHTRNVDFTISVILSLNLDSRARCLLAYATTLLSDVYFNELLLEYVFNIFVFIWISVRIPLQYLHTFPAATIKISFPKLLLRLVANCLPELSS